MAAARSPGKKPRGKAKVTVAEWAQSWPEQAHRARSEQTWRHYRERIGAFLTDFADRTLESFDRDEARQWVEAHPGNLTAVRAMFSDAEREGLIASNPFTRLGGQREEGQRTGVLSADELDELVTIAARVHGPYGRVVYGPMLAVVAWAGLDPGELYGLCPEDVDLQACTLEVHQAMRGRWPPALTEISPRRVALLPRAEDALEYVGVSQLPDGEPIFRTQQGKWFHQRLQAHYWQPVRDQFASGLPESHWLNVRIAERGDKGRLMMGELRHLFGAQLAARGVGPGDVAAMMGDRDGGARAERTYFVGRADDAIQRALEAFRSAA